MEITLLITLFHIIGVALGVGGATVSDLLFFRALADKKISRDELNLLHTLSYVLWAGLAILFLSGIGFITAQVVATGTSTYLVSAWFWAKMTIVFLLFCNALAMHNFIFPFMQAQVGERLDHAVIKPKTWLFATTGVVSILSWYSAMVLGVTRGLDLPYLYIINLYLVLLVFGILVAYVLFSVVVFPAKKSLARKVAERVRTKTTESGARTKAATRPSADHEVSSRTVRASAIVGMAVIAGLVIVSAAWFAVQKTAEKYVGASGQEHIVCITESAPWFTPDVLSIEVGDTVLWLHCHHDSHAQVDTRARSVFAPASALAHGGHHHDAGDAHDDHAHTHAIISIEGPEQFGSRFDIVGHVVDGDEYRFTFTKPGTYTYISPAHPYMKGIIAVGESAPTDSFWPPQDERIDPSVGLPEVSGEGELWLNAQFQIVAGQRFPGAVVIIDTDTWQVRDSVTHEVFSNPGALHYTPTDVRMLQAHAHDETLALLDPLTREVVETVAIGTAPLAIAEHPFEDRFYVALGAEGRVAVIDHSGTHLKDLIVPTGPSDSAISRDGRRMSVVSALNDKLTLFDLETEIIKEVFDLPGLPHATAITPDGQYAIGASYLEGLVRFFDTSDGEFFDVAVGTHPSALAATPDGAYLLVANSGSHEVSVIDMTTRALVATVPVAAGPARFAFGATQDNGTYAYVSHRFARVISVIDMDTFALVGQIPLPEDAWGGSGIVVVPNGEDE